MNVLNTELSGIIKMLIIWYLQFSASDDDVLPADQISGEKASGFWRQEYSRPPQVWRSCQYQYETTLASGGHHGRWELYQENLSSVLTLYFCSGFFGVGIYINPFQSMDMDHDKWNKRNKN